MNDRVQLFGGPFDGAEVRVPADVDHHEVKTVRVLKIKDPVTGATVESLPGLYVRTPRRTILGVVAFDWAGNR